MNLVNKLKHQSILVVGDLLLDRYIWGKVSRISPEAPIQILNIKSQEYRIGGAGNVANNLVKLKAKINFLGIANNPKIISGLKKNGISNACLIKDKSWKNPVKTRFIAHNQQVLRVDNEENQQISKKTEKRIFTLLKKNLKKSSLVILSDYLKGTLTKSLTQSICNLCKKYKKIFSLYYRI